MTAAQRCLTSHSRRMVCLSALEIALVLVALSACGRPDVGAAQDAGSTATPLPTLTATLTAAPATTTQFPASATTVLVVATAITATPPQIQAITPATPTTVFLPTVAVSETNTAVFSGSVLIEGGRCCAGGVAGSTIALQVAFVATSQAAPVTEMRTGRSSGCKDGDLSGSPWEPFVATKTYTTSLAINWVGWYIGVQYRDGQNNISPIYCDDISLEGMPAPPQTPTP